MEEVLSEQEKKFFESGGQEEFAVEEEADTREAETPPEDKKVSQPAKPAEVPAEKKEPAKFTYSKDTDNVVDENGRKYVPLGAVQEARNENKTLRRELEELKSKWTGGEAKLNKLMEALSGKQEEAPAYDKDPLGHLQAKNKALEEKIQALEQDHGNLRQGAEQARQIQAFSQTVQAAEREFSKGNPDYANAVEMVRQVWQAEYEMAGVPPQLIDSLLVRKGAQFTHAALTKEKNPAQAVYELAKRYGYKKSEVAEKKEEKSNPDKDKLKMIAEGQKAEKSLAGGKGSDFSLEALASMSDDEMDEFVKDPKNWKRLSKAA